MEGKAILIVDDEPSMRMALSESLVSCGYRVDTAVDGADGLNKFKQGRYKAVITDMRMPKANGMDVLRGIKALSPQTHVIVITAYGTVSTAVEAMKNGASDFIMKPFSLDELESVVRNVLADGMPADSALGRCREQDRNREIVAGDEKMLSLLEMLKCVAISKASIFIQGESGTGKELIARHIHRYSNRAGMPFVAVNCAAVPYNLLESEMFGYEKGAFTGAVQRKIGKFEMADGGTLLLDEVSEMDIHLQAKLLRAIQESEIDRLGGKEPVRVNVRIIATTNLDPKKCVAEKKFREDLYYRLNVIPIKVPPLRERKGDIPCLVDHFLKKFSALQGREKPEVSAEAFELLQAYLWPGNVRELENVMERAVLICSGSQIRPEHLRLDGEEVGERPPEGEPDEPSAPVYRNVTLYEMERQLIFDTLKQVKGNKTKASKILGISVRTMRNKLNEYGAPS
ncbi:MAG TPA: sigma-54 dependent transcriptional regulator [Syntrophales bacterium]|nr:sigma-54 dependent transcriptional regulator [Syntrophales bacterium]